MENALNYNALQSKINGFVPLILAFIIPWPARIFTPVLIGICAYLLITMISQRQFDFGVFRTKIYLLMLASLLVLAIGLVHTNDLRAGLTDLERNSMLMIFPFFIYQWRQFNVNVTALGFSFLAGIVLLTLFGFIYAFFALNAEELLKMFWQGHSYYSNFTSLHPTYLATFLVFGFFFITEHLRKHSHELSRAAVIRFILVLLYFFVLIIFLRARISIVIFGLTLVAYFVLIASSVGKKLIILASCIVTLIIGLMIVDVDNLFIAYGRNSLWAVEDRMAIWRSTWEGYKLSPLLGAGTGGAQYLIDEGFLKTGYDYGLDNAYNAHNQYLQNLCRNGILDLLLFVVICAVCYYKAIKQKVVMFFIFLFIVNVTMITETFLGKQKGIAFFYFFISAYMFLKNE